MARMGRDSAVRSDPDGAPLPGPDGTGVIALKGDAVDLRGTQTTTDGGAQQSWTKIQLVGTDAVPEGWVQSERVDLTGAPADGTIDHKKFARQLWWQYLRSGVNPYYLGAVAQLRSKISNGADGPNIGVFRLQQPEWDAVRADAQFGLANYQSADIADWRMQCVMFELMTLRAADQLTTALGRQPTWAELYLAQLTGPKAAAAAIKNPDTSISKSFSGLAANDLPPGGLQPDQILARYSKYFLDSGPPASPKKSRDASQLIIDDLDPALTIVSPDVDSVATEFVGDEADNSAVPAKPGGTTTIPVKPPVPQDIKPLPPGDGPPPVKGAGGPLGELIAKHESGKAGYGAFNRGGAGDSGAKKIDFSAMTVAQIMQLQALPRGNSQRLFAVGKYQLIPATMKDAVKTLGIDVTQNLGPKLQERLFRNYLVAIKRPKVKSFVTGGGASMEQAQMALALEFASIGEPGTGISHYAGSAGNKASTTPQAVAQALSDEKSSYEQFIANGKSPQQAWEALSPGMRMS